MPWRQDVKLEMQTIDDEGLVNKDLRDARGAHAIERFREGVPILSAREAPVGLPEAIYSKAWMESMETTNPRFMELKFRTSEDDFNWINWGTKHCNRTGRRMTEEK